MNLILEIVFILMFYFPKNEAAKTHLIPDQTVTQEGSSYVVMLKHDTAVPTECFIENDSQKYSVELSQRGITPSPVPKNAYLIQPKADDTDIITSLGNGICGFKMDSVSINSPTKWNISFVDQTRNTYYSIAKVTVRMKTPRHIIKKYKKVGAILTVDCAFEIQDLLSCKLYNPQNQLIKFGSDCYHFVQNSTLSDFGVWKCLLNFKTHMMPREDVFEFIPIATDIVQTWTNQTDNYINIGCSVTNSTQFTTFCLMTRPDGQEIVVSPGLATKRYMAIDTNVDNCMCSIQISLPLEKSEKGLWRCEQFNSLIGSSVGGYINVSAHESSYMPVPKIPSTVLAQINSTLTLTCRVPFSSSYCYMRGPDGFLYPVHNTRKSSLGDCEFVKETAQVTDNGTWICGFGRTTGEPDSVYSFQVVIPEPIQIQPKVEEIESRTAGTARLVCTTSGLGDSPLKYCRFLSPDGKMYQIENHQISDKMSYQGRGLEYGDCGIMLHDVSASDQGTWSCITRLERLNFLGDDEGTEEVYTNIHLTVNDSLSVASTLGIIFGVIIVVIVGTVFFIYRYMKRSNYQTALLASGVNPRLSQTSNATIQDNAGSRGYSSTDLGARYRSGALRNSSQSGGNDTSENIVEFDTTEDSTNNRIVNSD